MQGVCFGSCPRILPRKNVKLLVKETDGICRLLGTGSAWALPERGRQVLARAWSWGSSQKLAGTPWVSSVCCFPGGTLRCLLTFKLVCPKRPQKGTCIAVSL